MLTLKFSEKKNWKYWKYWKYLTNGQSKNGSLCFHGWLVVRSNLFLNTSRSLASSYRIAKHSIKDSTMQPRGCSLHHTLYRPSCPFEINKWRRWQHWRYFCFLLVQFHSLGSKTILFGHFPITVVFWQLSIRLFSQGTPIITETLICRWPNDRRPQLDRNLIPTTFHQRSDHFSLILLSFWFDLDLI